MEHLAAISLNDYCSVVKYEWREQCDAGRSGTSLVILSLVYFLDLGFKLSLAQIRMR